jgi:hypothetical protein
MIWALAKWKIDQHRHEHLGMMKTKLVWNKLIALELLFKYSAHRTPTPKLTSNNKGNSKLVILEIKHEEDLVTPCYAV